MSFMYYNHIVCFIIFPHKLIFKLKVSSLHLLLESELLFNILLFIQIYTQLFTDINKMIVHRSSPWNRFYRSIFIIHVHYIFILVLNSPKHPPH